MTSACLNTRLPVQLLNLELELLGEAISIQIAAGQAAEIGAALDGMRYLAEPTGRRIYVRRLALDDSLGPPLFHYRARPGEVVRVLQPRVRDPVGLATTLEAELLLAERYDCMPMVDELGIDLVDTRDPGYTIPVSGRLAPAEIR